MKTITDIFVDLVKVNSTNPPGNEKKIVEYIKNLYKDYDKVKMQEIEHGNNRSSLVIDIKGNTSEIIAFAGHIDTVPVPDPSKWTYDPFNATVVGDLLYGRGSSDMKSGAACMIYTGLHFLENNIIPNKSIRLIFTADEESSGIGIRSILDIGLINDVNNIIVPENTDEYIVIKEKGALWIKVQIYGKSAHGARPDLGLNSIQIMYELIESIRPFIESYCGDKLLGNSSISINKINGGEKINIIADYCEAEIDIRTNPDLDNEEVIAFVNKQVLRLTNKYNGLRIDIVTLTNRPALEISEDHDFIVGFKNVLNELGFDSNIKGVNYFTDLSLALPFVNKPFIIFGPGFEELGHQVDENCSISAVERVGKVYIEYCKK
jgi:succinyl-diaminopimelate desuccinylase